MSILKIIVGVGCFVAAFLPGGFAMACFAYPASGPYWAFLGSIMAVFAFGLVKAGWFLIANRDLAISMRAKPMIVVAILAGVFPVIWIMWGFAHVESRDRLGESQAMMKQLELAIRIYEGDYDGFPISTNISSLKSNDFTFGTWNTSVSALGITNATGRQANNSEIIAILRAWKDGPGPDTFRHTNAEGVLLDP
jgi:hypothetical protein